MAKRGSFGKSSGAKSESRSAKIPTHRPITREEADRIVKNMVRKGIRPDKAVEDLNRKTREVGNQF